MVHGSPCGPHLLGRLWKILDKNFNDRCHRCCRCPLFRRCCFSLSPWILCPHPHPSPTLIYPPFCWGVDPYRSCIVRSRGGVTLFSSIRPPPFPLVLSSIVCSRGGSNIVLVDTFPPASVVVVVDLHSDMCLSIRSPPFIVLVDTPPRFRRRCRQSPSWHMFVDTFLPRFLCRHN